MFIFSCRSSGDYAIIVATEAAMTTKRTGKLMALLKNGKEAKKMGVLEQG